MLNNTCTWEIGSTVSAIRICLAVTLDTYKIITFQSNVKNSCTFEFITGYFGNNTF